MENLRLIIRLLFACFAFVLIATTIPPNTIIANTTLPYAGKVVDQLSQILSLISGIGTGSCGLALLIDERIRKLRYGRPLDPYKLRISRQQTQKVE